MGNRGEAMIEYLIIAFFVSMILFGLDFTFREVMEPAYKRITAGIRWPIP